MPTPVTLPRLAWGDPSAPKRALLIHGLASSGQLMWLPAVTLADAGWYVEAIDNRGHVKGPRTLNYSIDAYAADAVHTRPANGGSWDLVVGHSLGGAAATLASGIDPEWARKLVLIDPALDLEGRDLEIIRESVLGLYDDPSVEAVRASHPHWHPLDHELKAQAAMLSSRWAIEQTLEQNATTWDVLDRVGAVRVPTHIIAGDPAVFSIFHGRIAARALENPHFTMSVVAGAGHSPQRDKPQEFAAQLLAAVHG